MYFNKAKAAFGFRNVDTKEIFKAWENGLEGLAQGPSSNNMRCFGQGTTCRVKNLCLALERQCGLLQVKASLERRALKTLATDLKSTCLCICII